MSHASALTSTSSSVTDDPDEIPPKSLKFHFFKNLTKHILNRFHKDCQGLSEILVDGEEHVFNVKEKNNVYRFMSHNRHLSLLEVLHRKVPCFSCGIL